MKLSKIIEKLEAYKKEFGDVEIKFISNDGRSSWVSSFDPIIKYQFTKTNPLRDKFYVIEHRGY